MYPNTERAASHLQITAGIKEVQRAFSPLEVNQCFQMPALASTGPANHIVAVRSWVPTSSSLRDPGKKYVRVGVCIYNFDTQRIFLIET